MIPTNRATMFFGGASAGTPVVVFGMVSDLEPSTWRTGLARSLNLTALQYVYSAGEVS
jgi:hypothetical protein